VNLDEIGDAYFEGSHMPQDMRIDKAFRLSCGCSADFGLSPEKVRKTKKSQLILSQLLA
jgi:hypothetical protein